MLLYSIIELERKFIQFTCKTLGVSNVSGCSRDHHAYFRRAASHEFFFEFLKVKSRLKSLLSDLWSDLKYNSLQIWVDTYCGWVSAYAVELS